METDMVMPLKSHFFVYMHEILIKGQDFILVLPTIHRCP